VRSVGSASNPSTSSAEKNSEIGDWGGVGVGREKRVLDERDDTSVVVDEGSEFWASQSSIEESGSANGFPPRGEYG